MSLWIPITLFAAFAQNLRFMLQRHLKVTRLSTAGATAARFVYSAPFVALLLLAYLTLRDLDLPRAGSRFLPFALIGGIAQIVATACVVALFAQRHFAVGIALKKSEVILTALTGFVLLGDHVAPLGVLAILIGFCGVLLLSDPPQRASALSLRARLFNSATGYGLAAGLFFGLSATCYRGAALDLASDDPLLRALTTLALVTAWQVLVSLLWLARREPDEIGKLVAAWRVSLPMGIASMLGSIAWFTAFALQNAAYVKALGQVELIFSFLGGWLVFGERNSAREFAGAGLIVTSILVLIAGV